jgi:hypothetical protein
VFDPTSRYAVVGTARLTVRDPDGRERVIVYARRRFIPESPAAATLAEHVVVQGDRLDRIAAAYLGDPLQFWRVADANRAYRPDDLTAEPGRTLRITLDRP